MITLWVNYNDLTVLPHWKWPWLISGNHPQMAQQWSGLWKLRIIYPDEWLSKKWVLGFLEMVDVEGTMKTGTDRNPWNTAVKSRGFFYRFSLGSIIHWILWPSNTYPWSNVHCAPPRYNDTGAFWTGERMTTIYANQRQTTEHTAKSIKFTHTESLGGRIGRWVGRIPWFQTFTIHLKWGSITDVILGYPTPSFWSSYVKALWMIAVVSVGLNPQVLDPGCVTDAKVSKMVTDLLN